ncbi:MAG: ABC transporter ATP-binding protein [Actinobacteria bacterium]|nr:ABC transporter ATP-binding protein [Actinomycetota bacterium]MCA1721122.1 ABC transporter ATP-binding protein [Actinomycetota bacterium]
MTGRLGTLVAQDVSKSFGDLLVLDGVDLVAGSGEVLAVLGPSGCGKSTLLRVLAGFETYEGQVEVDGEPVTAPSPRRGMVAQAGGLFPWLSLRTNLGFGPVAQGRSADEVRDVVDDLLRATGLTDFADALPKQLSGGMQQRASIAQVLANRPPVLLLDEPFGALDAQTRLRMHEWLAQLLSERPTTTVLVTHDVEEALLLGDRLALLSNRPARVVEELDIPFARDRGRAVLGDPEFVRLKTRVLDSVLSA